MYRASKFATLIGDKRTVNVYRLVSMHSDLVRYKLEHEEYASAENPRGVRIVDSAGYACDLAAGLAQDGRIG